MSPRFESLGLNNQDIQVRTFEQLLAIAAFLFVLVYGSGFLALFVLRSKEPELPRPFKVWGFPWMPLVILIGSAVFLIGPVISDTRNSLYDAALNGLVLVTTSLTAISADFTQPEWIRLQRPLVLASDARWLRPRARRLDPRFCY